MIFSGSGIILKTRLNPGTDGSIAFIYGQSAEYGEGGGTKGSTSSQLAWPVRGLHERSVDESAPRPKEGGHLAVRISQLIPPQRQRGTSLARRLPAHHRNMTSARRTKPITNSTESISRTLSSVISAQLVYRTSGRYLFRSSDLDSPISAQPSDYPELSTLSMPFLPSVEGPEAPSDR